MTESHCRLATCLAGKNSAERKTSFQHLVRHGFWKPSLKKQGSSLQTYIPTINTRHGLASVYPQGLFDQDSHYPEMHNLTFLKDYFTGNPTRSRNVGVMLQYYGAGMARSAGRLSSDDRVEQELAAERYRKTESREQLTNTLIQRLEDARIPDTPVGDNVYKRCQVKYWTKYGGMSRSMAETAAMQSMIEE